MTSYLFLLLLMVVGGCENLVYAQATETKDPLKDFCRRFGHATAEVDRKLFINGGLFDFNPISDNKYNNTSKLGLFPSRQDRRIAVDEL